MPIKLEDIERYGAPISFLKPGEVMVGVGPNSATFLKGKKIPLDGRHYCCAGKVILKNGLTLNANFEINTHTFDFLDRNSVRVFIEKERAWYSLDEKELFDLLHIAQKEAVPYTWVPDIPLDFHNSGPYPMTWQD
jgi:hypothetical protein